MFRGNFIENDQDIVDIGQRSQERNKNCENYFILKTDIGIKSTA